MSPIKAAIRSALSNERSNGGAAAATAAADAEDDSFEDEPSFPDEETHIPVGDVLPSPSLRDTASGTAAFQPLPPRVRQRFVLPLSMRILRSCGAGDCLNCNSGTNAEDFDNVYLGTNYCAPTNSSVSPLVFSPMVASDHDLLVRQQPIVERILADYRAACTFYHVTPNAGVLTCFRFLLPSLRVTKGFHDADMLAVAEILYRYCNGPLQHIHRLDFTVARLRGGGGFGSHGAFSLAKILQVSEHILEVYLDRNRIGSFGAAAIFLACEKNSALEAIRMRRCQVRERGAHAFATHVMSSTKTGLRIIDMSANHIGYRGCVAIERAHTERDKRSHLHPINVDLEGNLVFQEIMNGVTHGLGVLLAVVGASILSASVKHSSHRHVVSCSIYSTSLVVLYTSSTLYHSFFTMRNTKWIFEVMDKCAIYILIAGSYTPFLQIVLAHEPLWSIYLLAFLWTLCFLGIIVEFSFPTWKHKTKFSLFMYLCMGWSAVVCLPEVVEMLPPKAMQLMVLGGVAYTAGVPFFVRNNNLDHAIWHLFVLAGSMFHWCGIYFYVAPREAFAPVVAEETFAARVMRDLVAS